MVPLLQSWDIKATPGHESMVLVSIVQGLKVVSQLLLEQIEQLSSLPAVLVLLKGVHVLLRSDNLGTEGHRVYSQMGYQSKGRMEGDTKLELRILGCQEHANDSPAEAYDSHRTDLLLRLNKWQKFGINVLPDHIDCKLGNKVLDLLLSYIGVLLVEHLSSEEVSHVHCVALVC